MRLQPGFAFLRKPCRFSVVLLLAALSCGKDHVQGPDVVDEPTVDVTWKLDCVGDSGSDTCYKPREPGGPYTIRFAADGSVVGTNACNTCTGTYTRSGSSLSIDWACTEIACGDPSQWLDYDAAIVSVRSFVVTSDGALVLRYVDARGAPLELWHYPAP